MSTAASTGAPASTGSASTGASTGAASSSSFSWGDGWRSHIAAGTTDPEKELKQLERYESPEQVWKKARELEGRMSRGELRPTLRKDASPEERAQWRKDNGVPDKPEDYKITLPAGRQAPKEDDAFLKSFLKSAHDAHYTQGQVDMAISSFYAEVDRQTAAATEAEKALTDKAEEKLRQEWGADYKTNKAMAEALLARAPAGFRDRFMNGFLDDHTPIRASVDGWKWLVQIEREINPYATVVPGGSADAATVDARIKELKGLMGNPSSSYWEGPKSQDMQDEYRRLVSARDRAAAKAA